MDQQLETLEHKTSRKKPWIHNPKKMGFSAIILFFVIFGFWAYMAPLESAAIAPGKIIVSGYQKTIQHLEGGIIAAILISEGSKVKRDQPLIQLDDVRAKIILELRKNQVHELLANEARLQTELADAKEITVPKRLLVNNNNNKEKVKQILKSQNAIFQTKLNDYINKTRILNQRIGQLQKQISGYQSQFEANQHQLQLIDKEVTTVAHLVEKRLIEESRLLSLQREAARLKGNLGNFTAQIAVAQQKIGETNLQLSGLKTERLKKVVTELRDTQQKLYDALEKEKAAIDNYEHMTIRSPIAVIVTGLKKHTVGGVVSPGEAVMDVVPTDTNLEIEAKVSPLDIDVVHVGLKAKIGLTAFKQRNTPKIIGEVTHVSANVFEDKQTRQMYYQAIIKIEPQELAKLKGLVLYPGMPVEVMIITDRLTLFEYLIAPIKDSVNRAFRES